MKKVMLMLSVMICALVALIPALKVSADDGEETKEAKAVTVNEAEAGVVENTLTAEADEAKGLDVTSVKAIVAGAIIIGGAVAGALGMAFAIGKAVESTARQPEAGADIRSTMMLGLVFIETAIIYALIVAILVIFVL